MIIIFYFVINKLYQIYLIINNYKKKLELLFNNSINYNLNLFTNIIIFIYIKIILFLCIIIIKINKNNKY